LFYFLACDALVPFNILWMFQNDHRSHTLPVANSLMQWAMQ